MHSANIYSGDWVAFIERGRHVQFLVLVIKMKTALIFIKHYYFYLKAHSHVHMHAGMCLTCWHEMTNQSAAEWVDRGKLKWCNILQWILTLPNTICSFFKKIKLFTAIDADEKQALKCFCNAAPIVFEYQLDLCPLYNGQDDQFCSCSHYDVQLPHFIPSG